MTSSSIFKDFDHKFIWQLSVRIKKIKIDSTSQLQVISCRFMKYEPVHGCFEWFLPPIYPNTLQNKYFHYTQIFHRHSVAAWRQGLSLKTSQKSFRGEYSRIQVLVNSSWIFFTWGATLFISRGLTPVTPLLLYFISLKSFVLMVGKQ